MTKRKTQTALTKTAKPTVLPPSTTSQIEAEKLVPRHNFARLTFWSELNESMQDKLATETQELILARKQFGMSGLLMGQHLLNVRTMLADKKGAFAQYLRIFNFAGRTGYRFIEDYERLMAIVNEPVVKVMLATGFTLRKATRKRPLGDYTEAYHALASNSETPPKGQSVDAAIRWVKKLEAQAESLKKDPRSLEVVRKQIEQTLPLSMRQRRDSYDFLIKQSFHLVKSAIRRVETDRKQEFITSLIGYILTEQEMNATKFVPQEIPQWLNRAPGRPSAEETNYQYESERQSATA